MINQGYRETVIASSSKTESASAMESSSDRGKSVERGDIHLSKNDHYKVLNDKLEEYLYNPPEELGNEDIKMIVKDLREQARNAIDKSFEYFRKLREDYNESVY